MDTASIIFAIALPVALMTVPLTAIIAHHRRRIVEMQLEAGRKGTDRAGYEELEERMRILERIVTDKGFDVAHQIEALRDTTKLPERELDRQG